jgi:hypothetical protein
MRSRFDRQRIVAMAATVILAATVAACGDNSTATDAGSGSPLNDLFGGNISPAEARKRDLAMQTSMAQCMKEAGWEYKPIDYSAQFPQQAAGDQDLSPAEFGKKYFYGTVHNYELYELPGIGTGENGVPATALGQGFVDPNQDYMQSLSSEDQQKYQEALYGAQINQEPTVDTVTGEPVYVPPPVEQQGCSGKAQLAAYGQQPYNNPDFSKRYEELSQKMEKDPRVSDAETAWSDCMYDLDAKYNFGKSQDAPQSLEAQMQEAKGLKQLPVDPTTHQPIGDYDQNQGYMSTIGADGKEIAFVGTPKAIKKDRLEELRAFEKDLWTADQKCQKKVGLLKIRKDVEQELVDTLLQEFPEFKKNQS